jgi:hypothetical protein
MGRLAGPVANDLSDHVTKDAPYPIELYPMAKWYKVETSTGEKVLINRYLHSLHEMRLDRSIRLPDGWTRTETAQAGDGTEETQHREQTIVFRHKGVANLDFFYPYRIPTESTTSTTVDELVWDRYLYASTMRAFFHLRPAAGDANEFIR